MDSSNAPKAPKVIAAEAFAYDRVRSAQLSAAIERLTQQCFNDCRKPNLSQCPECFGKLIDMLHDRYISNYDACDWFVGRSEFMAKLESMLTAAKDGKTTVQEINDAIKAEKMIWAQEHKKSLEAHFLESRPGYPEKLAKEREALASLDEEKLMQTVEALIDSDDRCAAQIDLILPDAPAAVKEKYVAMLRDGKSLAQVLETMAKNSAERSSRRAKLMAELGKLQRAKAASIVQAQKKKEFAAQQMRIQNMKLPLCAACGAAVSPAGHIQCDFCFIFTMFETIPERTVFCCRCESYKVAHTAKKHICAAGVKCVYSLDVARDANTAPTEAERPEEPVFCIECLKIHKIPGAVFCEVGCAKASFQAHREQEHLSRRRKDELKRDVAQLDKINFTTYTAKNIHDHVIPMSQALHEAELRDQEALARASPDA